MLTKEKFEALAKVKNNPCISIYMPTERVGKDVLEGKGSIQLKTKWKDIKEELKKRNIENDKISSFETSINELIEDKKFWRHQLEGLAIFLAPGFFRYFSLPINFESFHYISDDFYLKPLIPGIAENTEFYLLSLQLDEVNFFKGSKNFLKPLKINDLVPNELEDRVGHDYEQKNLRSSTSFPGETDLHGYDAANRDKINEITRFFRAVNDGIMELIEGETYPLVIACDDARFSIYKKVNTYKNLFEEKIPGNPSDYNNLDALHKKVLDVLKPHFEAEKQKKLHQFRELNQTKRSSTSIEEILPAIYQGKVDTLFVRANEDVWGRYNENMTDVEIHEGPDHTNKSLTNLATVKVLEQGGSVFVMEDGFLPQNNAKMNALYRYSS